MSPAVSPIKQNFVFGPFRLAIQERRLFRNDATVMLPPKEFDLLLLLVRNPGVVMSRESLIKALWPNTIVEEANLNVHISALRKVLAEGQGEHQYIETLPRLGYRFIAPVNEVPQLDGPAENPAEASLPQPLALADGEKARTESVTHLHADQPAIQSSTWYARHRLAAVTFPLWLLAGTLLGILALLFFKQSQAKSAASNETAPSATNVIPLTSYSGRESSPAFSPDGNQIAFVWDGGKEANTDIYVRLVDGGNWVRVTTHPGDDVNPAWSPDGRTIAFYRSTPEGDGIFLVPSLGGAERKLTDTWANRFGFGSYSWLHWSPDGKWLVVSDKTSAENPFSLFLVSAETGERRLLTTPPASIIGDCSPAFSPDGRQVAFVRVVSAVVGELNLVSVNGGEPKRLTFDAAGADTLAWTSNGRELVYSSRHSGKSRLMKLPVEGGTPQWLAACGNEARYPAFSPHGNRLAWRQNTENEDIFRISLKGNHSAATNASGPPSSVIASTAKEVSPRYSPDGKRIVFVSTRSGSEEIWVCGSAGENPTRLTSFRGPLAGSPSWSPDGKQIVFDCRPDGNADLFIVSSDGGQAHRLTTDSAEDIVPSWSRDSRWIYFTSNRSGRLQIWKMTVAGDQAVQLTRQGGFEPMESPDGQWVYFSQDRGSSSIWSVPVAGGEETPVFDFHQKIYSRAWVVTEQGIYFAVSESPAQSSIRFFSFSTGSIKTTVAVDGNLPGGVSGLTLSPDKNWLLFPMVAQRGSDLMMIENFH